jgi:hypothetical protein
VSYARHCLILLTVLMAGLAARSMVDSPHTDLVARWPANDALFEVDGWTVGPEVQLYQPNEDGAALIQRTYTGPGGEEAEFVLWSVAQPRGQQLLRKGPDRDYLGAGFTTEAAPAGLVPPIPGGGAMIARQGPYGWLLLYSLGERRGALGNGAPAWLFAELDAVLDQPNHYFLARISLPFGADEPPPAAEASRLARTLFPRLTEWYAQVDDGPAAAAGHAR